MYKEIKESCFIGGRGKIKEENNIYFKQFFLYKLEMVKGGYGRRKMFLNFTRIK